MISGDGVLAFARICGEDLFGENVAEVLDLNGCVQERSEYLVAKPV